MRQVAERISIDESVRKREPTVGCLALKQILVRTLTHILVFTQLNLFAHSFIRLNVRLLATRPVCLQLVKAAAAAATGGNTIK